MSERVQRLELGALSVPDDWDVSVEAVVRAHPRQPVPHLAARPGSIKDPPAPTLIVQRRPAGEDAIGLLRTFLEKTAAATHGMRVSDAAPLAFTDGTSATSVEVMLETAPPVIQQHVARLDAGMLTHFVLAAAAGDADGMATLRRAIASWRPPGS